MTILRSKHPLKEKINFGLYDRIIKGTVNGKPCSLDDPCFSYNKVSILPLTLLLGQTFVLSLILSSAIKNKFQITFRSSLIGLIIYGSVIIGLVIYSLLDDVQAPSG